MFSPYSDLVQIPGFWQWVLARIQWIFMTCPWAPHLTESATAKTSPALSFKWTSLQIADISRYSRSAIHRLHFRFHTLCALLKLGPRAPRLAVTSHCFCIFYCLFQSFSPFFITDFVIVFYVLNVRNVDQVALC